MAMTVRLPAELDEKLEQIAAARHTSKHAVLIEAANRFVTDEFKTAMVLAAVDRVTDQYADAIQRLEDA
ncbi:MAG: ribbon-helix-helix protein, CopG family [Leucobacter sp.]